MASAKGPRSEQLSGSRSGPGISAIDLRIGLRGRVMLLEFEGVGTGMMK